jgi:hypothetical protein
MEVAALNKHGRPSRATKNDVTLALQALLSGPLSGSAEKDVEAFTNLCCISAIPAGTEDPKAIVRSMSDSFVETAKLQFCELAKNRVASQVVQFLFMEWCWRHGHLEEDWKWAWKSRTEGDLRYRERIPLHTLGFAN